MNKQIHNELSDAQLDAISGGCWSGDYGHGRDKDCDYDRKKSGCGDEPQRKHRGGHDDCRPSYRPNRCG